MPATSLMVLVALACAAAPFDDSPRAERADYRAAFDDSIDSSSPDAWPTLEPAPNQRAAVQQDAAVQSNATQQNAARQDSAARQGPADRPAAATRLPIQFHPAGSVHSDSALRPAVAAEPAALPQRTAADGGIPLAPPEVASARRTSQFSGASPATVLGSLGAVVGLFLIVAWIMRRGAPKGSGVLPREVVEVLGRTALVGRQQLQLLRLGNKLVLISVSPTGVESVAEVTDPAEVDRLCGLCYQGHPQSATASFRQVFQSFEDPRGGYTKGRTPDLLDLAERAARPAGKEAARGR